MGQVCLTIWRRQAPLTTTQAIQKLQETEETFRKKMAHLEVRQGRLTEEAKQYFKKGNRRTAKDCLRQRLQLAAMMTRLENQRTLVFELQLQLEQSSLMELVVGGIKQGHQALREVNQRVDVDKVDKLLGDIQDQVDHSNDVLQRVEQAGSDLAASVDIDEEELERELAALVDPLPPPPFPAPPTREPIREEENDFTRLSQEMNQPLLAG
jgi:division protein CdvB (Snf7/Vps24/ESCRT-III family)